jgi:predicted phosphodiesterase
VRLAVLADIHGNLPALDAVLEDVEAQHVDDIVVAGDFVGGPQPGEVLDRLRPKARYLVRGNGENYMLDYHTGAAPPEWRESKQWTSMRWGYLSLTSDEVEFIATLPEQQVITSGATTAVHVVHGSPRSPNEHTRPDPTLGEVSLLGEGALLLEKDEAVPAPAMLAHIAEPVLVCGHSHIPWQQRLDGKLALNPGSVGNPLNGDARAQYAVLSWTGTEWSVTHRAVAYDLGRLRRVFETSGYLEYGGAFALSVLLSTETGHNVTGAFLTHAARLAAESGCGEYVVLPDTVWNHAVETFEWQHWERAED